MPETEGKERAFVRSIVSPSLTIIKWTVVSGSVVPGRRIGIRFSMCFFHVWFKLDVSDLNG